MGLDTLTYEKLAPSLFEKEVLKEDIVVETKQINDPAFEIVCLEAQISDMQLGVQINPESQPEIDVLIANYQEAIAILKS